MKITPRFANGFAVRFLLVLFFFSAFASGFGQAPAFFRRLPIGDFAVYAEGNHGSMMDSIAYGVNLRKHVLINNGHVGSNFFVDVADSGVYNRHFFSGNRIRVGNGNKFSGNFHINNETLVTWPVLKAGNNEFGVTTPSPGGGLIASRGHVHLGPTSTVLGPVFLKSGYTYTGPPPTNGVHTDTNSLPVMPLLPYITPFPSFSGNHIINTNITLTPGPYGDLILDGSTGPKTITLSAPGTYVFKSIKLTGKNTINFNFPPDTKGYRIYVHEDVDLGPVTMHTNGAYVFNNPLAARIFWEVHGTGTPANGGFPVRLRDAPAPNSANFLGTVYAPFGSIRVGNIHPTYVDGALWSKRKVEVMDNVTIMMHKLVTPKAEIDPYYPAPTGGKADPAAPKIGAELHSLVNYRTTIDTISSNTIFQLDSTTERVMIEVVPKDGQYASVHSYLVANGLTDTISSGGASIIITGNFPIDSLTLLNTHPDIYYVRPLFVPLNNAGIVLSQGDAKMKSDLARTGFNLSGAGVKIGVISDSYNNKGLAGEDVTSGDLPSDVQLVKEYTATSGTDEGRAMMQIIHDIAPSAKLAFRTGTVSSGDFASGIRELATTTLAGGACNIIVDDVTWPTEPFFRDGCVAKAVNEVKAQGVTYFSAAGNFGTRAYESTFASSGVTPDGLSGPAHAFGSDYYQSITLKTGSYMIVLQWDDDVYSLGGNDGAQTDLDMYLLEFGGTTLFGFNRDNIGNDPIEILPFVVNEETTAKLAVVRASGTATPRFKFIIFRGDGTIVDNTGVSSTLVGQANAAGAIAVGAMLYDNISGYVTTPNTVASFSSRGGTVVKENGVFGDRQKPDLVAPNGVNTKVSLGGTDIEGDGLPNFFGTSAAAPHAAGVAALIIEAKKKYFQQSTVTPDEIKALLTATADDLHDAGWDSYSGYGLINADSAMRSLANPVPTISAIYATDSLNPGTKSSLPTTNTAFALLVEGENFTTSTKIVFAGSELETNYLSDSSLWAITNSFTGNPSIRLQTAAKTSSQLDGGFSDSMKMYENKRVISIKVNNASRKYGENDPAFSSTITVDGEPIATSGFTLQQLGLDKLAYSTTASIYSPVYTYPVTVSLTLDPVSDSALIAQNVYQLGNAGVLTVKRLPVKITPQNKTITYGDDLGVVSYNYEFTQSGMTNSNVILDSIKAIHEKYLADNVLAVVHGFNLPQANGSALTANDLTNMSTMASFQSIRNARQYIVVDGKLIPLTYNVTDDEMGLQRLIVDVSAQSLYNYNLNPDSAVLVTSYMGEHARSLVNAKSLANGIAYVEVNGQAMAMVNGQLMTMVNGQVMAMVNGQVMAMINGQLVEVESLSMVNGQVMAMVNGQLMAMVNGQLMVVINGVTINIDLNTDIAEVNGQVMAMVNGQAMAMVNGNLMSIVNGQVMAMVNGQAMAMVNGQVMAMVNGQAMAMVNGEMQLVTSLYIQNGQVMAMVNGQAMAMVNGQVMAMVNNQLVTLMNGQLMALVNGEVQFVTEITIVNGQVMAMVNGQAMAMVNGQVMAMVNGTAVSVDNFYITNGQVMAMVNGQAMAMVNGQAMAMVNGQAMAMVNNSGFGGTDNNSNSALIIDEDDIDVQGRAIGGMAAVNMITGLDVGVQKLVPGTFSDDNFEITYGLGEVTINPATLTVTVKDTSRNYGAVNPEFTVMVTGYVNDDHAGSVTLPQATTTATQSSGAGTYPIMLTGANASNYTLNIVNGTLTINKADLALKVNDTTKPYGAANPVFTLSASGFVNGDDLGSITVPQVATTATQQSPAGVYPITLTGGASGNYNIILEPGTLTVGKAVLSITALDESKIYGGANPALGYMINGFMNGDDENDIVPPGIGTIATISSVVGNYPIILSGGYADNYDIVLQHAVLSITPAPLLITANDASRVYGQPNPVFTMAYAGFVNGDNPDVITLPQLATTATQASGTGRYPIILEGGSAANYSITLKDGVLLISPAALTIKADDVAKLYGESNPPLTTTITGFVNGDDAGDIVMPQVSTTATVASGAGSYPIVLSGGTADNYTITLVNGSLNVGRNQLIITANNVSRSYGETNPAFTMSFSGFVNSDDQDDIVLPSIASPATVTSFPGNYPVELLGGSAANYELVLVNGTLSIGKAPLTITADLKVINRGASLPVFTATSNGLRNGDVISGITYSASTINTGLAGVYTNMPYVNGAAYPQYNINFVAGEVYVNPYGTGAKKIIVKRECVRKLIPAVDGYGYEVVFSYENPNTTAFYVPRGSNNSITIANGGAFENLLPEVFQPGKHMFSIRFNGQQLSWSVTTLGSTHTTANAAANNANGNCGNTVAKGVTIRKTVEEEITVYPNPASTTLHITISDGELKDGGIVLSDVMGRTQRVTIVHQYSSLLQLDVSSLAAGTYVVRLQTEKGIRTLKFVKQ